MEMLRQHGHVVLPVTPRKIQLANLPVYPDLRHTPPPIDTVTLYVNPQVVESLVDEIIAARPSRVIFNPGTEHAGVANRLESAGIKTMAACTLVLLSTGQFG